MLTGKFNFTFHNDFSRHFYDLFKDISRAVKHRLFFNRIFKLTITIDDRFRHRDAATLAQNIIFLDQEAGVRGNNAVAQTKIYDAVYQFRLFTLHPNLGQQMTDRTGCPQSWNKIIAARLTENIIRIFKRLFFTVQVSGQSNAGWPWVPISADNNQLCTSKQVGQLLRIHLLHDDPVCVDLDVGQHRRAYFCEKRRHLFIDALMLTNIGGCATMGAA